MWFDEIFESIPGYLSAEK